ncbi:MAG: hypothetical protein ACLVAW_12925 [Eisenbergiella massiliensis]
MEPKSAACVHSFDVRAQISGGEQTGCITVRGGGKALHPCCFEIPSDRIGGTYLCACWLRAVRFMKIPGRPAERHGGCGHTHTASLRRGDEGLWVQRRGIFFAGLRGNGQLSRFSTDLQSPLLVAMALADGESRLKETILMTVSW